MKQYKFSLKDECMIYEKSYSNSLSEIISDIENEDNLDIPVPKQFLNQFENDKVYNEDEFEIKQDCHDDSTPPFSNFCSYCSRSKGCDAPLIAVPKQKSEAELWQEAAMILFKKHNPDTDFNSDIGRRLFDSFKKDSDELKKHFAITRKA